MSTRDRLMCRSDLELREVGVQNTAFPDLQIWKCFAKKAGNAATNRGFASCSSPGHPADFVPLPSKGAPTGRNSIAQGEWSDALGHVVKKEAKPHRGEIPEQVSKRVEMREI